MSLRWKLLRFQTAEKLLPAAPPPAVPPAGPVLRAPPAEPPTPSLALLRRLADAADRAAAAHAARGTFALPRARGAVEVFYFPAPLRRRAAAAGATAPLPLSPAHFLVQAHESTVAAVHVVDSETGELPVFVTVGLDSRMVSVKLWQVVDLEKGEPAVAGSARARFADDLPPEDGAGARRLVVLCVATLRMPSEAQPSAVAVRRGAAGEGAEGLRVVAVGFDDASVEVFQGNLARERYTRARLAQAPGEMRDARPVTFLAFCDSHLMVVTEQSVAVLRPVYDGLSPAAAAAAAAPSGDNGEKEKVLPREYEREALDSRGALEGHTVAYVARTEEIVVAREEALYFFNKDGRAQCLAFPSEGANACIAAVGPYIIHAAMPNSVVVYDVATRVIAYRGTGDVRSIFTDEKERSTLLVMTDKSVFLLEETPLPSRVHTLLSRGMYTAAIAMAKAEETAKTDDPQSRRPSTLFATAVQQYAEFLMGKNDYDAAATLLIGTIGGSTEPSEVIKRLVEQPGLRSGLRSYLESLHYAGEASFVHTRVLITCYRHDRARAAILQNQAPAQNRTTDEHIIQVLTDVDWSVREVDMAIDLCCSAGLYGVAENVARRRGRSVRLARTLVEHLDNVPAGLELLRSPIDRRDAFEIADVCGRKLLAQAPEEFVAAIAEIINRGSQTPAIPTENSTSSHSNNTLWPAITGSRARDAIAPVAHVARLFVDRPRWLASLLESVVSKATTDSRSDEELEALWTMLFEALIRVDVDRISGAPTGRSALKILQSRTAKINLRKALAISEQHGHTPCLEYVYEHLRMYRELAQLLRITGDSSGMLRACRRHGKRESMLWLEALRLFAPQVEILCPASKTSDPIGAVTSASEEQVDGAPSSRLGKIGGGSRVANKALEYLQEAMLSLDSSGQLSPGEIVEAVCNACPRGEWDIVRTYFDRTVGNMAARAKDEEFAALALGAEAMGTRAECTRLEEAVIVKSRFCGICDDSLSSPSAHFFCGHSFHVACVSTSATSPLPASESQPENNTFGLLSGLGPQLPGFASNENPASWAELECPRCAPELDAVVSMRNALEEKNVRHDDFYRILRSAKQDCGFDAVISFLSRSPFLSGV